MDLYLREVDHATARDNFRVILKMDAEEVDIGSIGLKTFTSDHTAGTWGIDIVIPLRAHRSEGHAIDLKQCTTSFRTAWEFHCEEAGWLDEFLAKKRQRR